MMGSCDAGSGDMDPEHPAHDNLAQVKPLSITGLYDGID
jgi:hypothetical protein